MGEVAITLDAFDEEFEKALYPLSASDAVRPVAPSASSPPRRCCVQAVVADAHLVFENGPALTPPSPPSPPLASQLSAEAWAPQQKAGELLDWMYGRIPNHVGAAKLIEAGELLLAKGQHELARRECFAVVASAGLLASEDHRWERAARDEAHGPCVEKDRLRHVQACRCRAVRLAIPARATRRFATRRRSKARHALARQNARASPSPATSPCTGSS